MTHRAPLFVALLFAHSACQSAQEVDRVDEDIASPGDAFDDPSWPVLEGACDPLVPEFCAFPFPNDAWLAPDETSPTGRRVDLPDGAMPSTNLGVALHADAIRRSDGWSAGSTVLSYVADVDPMDLTAMNDLERSVTPDSTTLILDTATGEFVPHFAELDMSHAVDDQRALILNPAIRLSDETRYIVAFHGLHTTSGESVAPSPTFAALRDELASDEPSVDSRRDRYEDIFGKLADAGVDRSELQLAWDFTTSSRENNTAAMLSMRDEALASLETAPLSYTLDAETYSSDPGDAHYDPYLAMRIEGTLEVPLYLDKEGPGGRFVLGDDGLPIVQGTAEYPFLVLVPWSAVQNPARIVHYGHGLFGDRYHSDKDELLALANAANVVFASMDWIGMSRDDVPGLLNMVITGDIGAFNAIPDRSQQGFLNHLLFYRTLLTTLVDDPDMQFGGQRVYDPSKRGYYGGSLGAIYGSSYLAISPDIDRGLLAVGGESFAKMLPRSVHFDRFLDLLQPAVEDARATPFLVSAVQMLWDRAEPNGYAYGLVDDPLPGATAKDILSVVSLGDHQVPNFASRVMARSMGLPLLTPTPEPVFGLASVDGEHPGSGYLEVDFGLGPVPETNEPMREGDDPHGGLIEAPDVLEAMIDFLSTGVAIQPCDGPCEVSR